MNDQSAGASNRDPLPLNGLDHIEMYVGNALQAAHYFITAFGFRPHAHAGLQTGLTEKETYVVAQGDIRLALTAPLISDSEIGEQLDKHGDSVKYIAFTVDDAEKSFEQTILRNASPHLSPTRKKDEHGEVVVSGIKAYGDTAHLFIDRRNYTGSFLPGYRKWESNYPDFTCGLHTVDHMVANVGWGEMETWSKYYADILGFRQLISFDDKDISTEYTALMSKVMADGKGKIKFPINEPAEGKKRSQIEEYLDFHNGPGVQHIAVAADNIIHTVNEMKNRGVEFLHVPSYYYDSVPRRVGEIEEELEEIRELGILVDRDEDGYLLQIFTKPVCSRPTLFFEIIQRKGAKSFGKGNFKALFEAIEREQELRGTL